MAASATGSARLSITGNLVNTLTDSTIVPATIGNDRNLDFTSGTGANAFNRGWKKHEWALADAATVNLDLYDLGSLDIGAGVGEDPLGLTQANTELVGMMIDSEITSVGSVMIGGEGSAAAWQSLFHVSGTLNDTAGLKLLPGAVLVLIAPLASAYAIADTSNHLLKFAAAGGAVEFNADFFLRGA
jgi:hypothetical protein